MGFGLGVAAPTSASLVSVNPSGLAVVTTTDVQAALAELDAAVDAIVSGGDVELLAQHTYDPGSLTTYTTTDSTVADLDATNLVITFVAPPSGKVNVVLQAAAEAAATNQCFWAVREGSTTVARRFVWRAANSTPYAQIVATLPVTGLVAGSSHTYKWAGASADTNDVFTFAGDTFGPFIMQVFAVP